MKKAFSEKSLIGRIRILLVLSVALVAIVFTVQAYFNNIENYRKAVSNKLEAVTKSVSQVVAGEDHLKITNRYHSKDVIKTNNQDSNYLKIQRVLKSVKEANGLKSSIYTMIIDSNSLELERPIFRFVVASSENPFFFHSFSTYPTEELEKFTEGAVLKPYDDENGTWISAFAPIRTAKGKVIAIVQADIEFDEYIAVARKEALLQLVIIPPILVLIFLVSTRLLKNIITREDMVVKLKDSLIIAEKERTRAEEALKGQEIFLAKVSHEMRTPLNGIIGITNLIDKNKLSEEEQKNLNLVVSSGKGLLLIINDLLDVSKIESGNLSLENLPFNIEHSSHSIASLLKAKMDEKNIRFQINIDAIKGNFIGDDLRYRQVLTNLLSNAVKFTPVGGVIELYVKQLKDSKQNSFVRIGVKDSGIGIAKEKQAHIFEQFKQENDDTTREFGGTGLGLSICKSVVELFGGELCLESKKGNGAHFYFEIEFERTDKERVSRFSSVELDINLSGRNILVVDDNEVNLKIATNVILKKGGQVVKAENGAVAIEAVKEKIFDVILMDIQMPVMGGEEATEVIKRDLDFNGSIIALTANAIEGERERYLEMGFDDYLSKPFNPSDLYAKIGSLLDIPVNNLQPNINTSDVENEATNNEGADLYDLTVLEMLAGGDEDFKKDILKTFVGQVDESLLLLSKFFNEKEFERLGKLAHKYNSSVDSIGLKNGKKILKDLEIACKAEVLDLVFIQKQIETISDLSSKVKSHIESNHIK